MRICVISTPIFTLPLQGYGGLEALVYSWSLQFQKAGHEISIVAPEGSQLPEGIELIPIQLMGTEEAAYLRYKGRLEDGGFDAIMDNTWSWYSVISQMSSDKQLPIIHIWHSDPNGLGSAPPIRYPNLVGLSKIQAEMIGKKWGVMCKMAYNGVDLSFYKPDPAVKRGNRYLWMARYTPEKGFLEAAHLAKKCRVGLDAFGDTTIISSQDYLNKCVAEGDGMQIRVSAGISREQTVKEYQGHKALITWTNYTEIFGLSTVESMACGTPVIARNTGAAPELIKHGKTGFLCETLEEMEDLIKTDAVDRIRAEDCIKQASRFSIESSAHQHLKCLEDIANGHHW